MIGYLGLARETFDIKFAKKKFNEAIKILQFCTKNTIFWKLEKLVNTISHK